MKLDAQQFKRWKQLKTLVASKKASENEIAEFKELDALKNQNSSNPVELWNKYPTLFRDSTNIPFNYRKGTDFTLPTIFASEVNDMPAIVHGARIEYVKTPGRSINANQGLNYQSRKLWLAMHRKYRGLGTYEYADLGITIWAIGCAFADLGRAERIYGLFNEYQVMNRTVPEGILSALNLDPASVNGLALADFRYELNRLITKAKTLCLPKGIGVVESFILLDSNVFKDSDSHRATWYVYDSPHRVQYDATASTGGRTIYVNRTVNNSGKYTLESIIADLNTDFDILLTDTDVARICSDMIAAIGGGDTGSLDGLMTLNLVPEDYKVVPVRDDSRLLQLHNTTLVGTVVPENVPSALSRVASGVTLTDPTAQTLQVYQQNGVIICNFGSLYQGAGAASTYTAGSGVDVGAVSAGYPDGLPGGAVLDIWKDDVSPDDIMEMTRQTVALSIITYTSGSNIYKHNALTAYGNILCTKMIIYYMQGVGGVLSTGNISIDSSLVHELSYPSSRTGGNASRILSALSQIDWHPIMVGVERSTNNKIMFGDIDNFVYVTANNLYRLHDCAMISGWMTAIGEAVQGDK